MKFTLKHLLLSLVLFGASTQAMNLSIEQLNKSIAEDEKSLLNLPKNLNPNAVQEYKNLVNARIASNKAKLEKANAGYLTKALNLLPESRLGQTALGLGTLVLVGGTGYALRDKLTVENAKNLGSTIYSIVPSWEATKNFGSNVVSTVSPYVPSIYTTKGQITYGTLGTMGITSVGAYKWLTAKGVTADELQKLEADKKELAKKITAAEQQLALDEQMLIKSKSTKTFVEYNNTSKEAQDYKDAVANIPVLEKKIADAKVTLEELKNSWKAIFKNVLNKAYNALINDYTMNKYTAGAALVTIASAIGYQWYQNGHPFKGGNYGNTAVNKAVALGQWLYSWVPSLRKSTKPELPVTQETIAKGFEALAKIAKAQAALDQDNSNQIV